VIDRPKGPGKRVVRITVRLPETLHAQILEAAGADRRSKSDLFVIALEAAADPHPLWAHTHPRHAQSYSPRTRPLAPSHPLRARTAPFATRGAPARRGTPSVNPNADRHLPSRTDGYVPRGSVRFPSIPPVVAAAWQQTSPLCYWAARTGRRHFTARRSLEEPPLVP
jgi:hypothetical protein